MGGTLRVIAGMTSQGTNGPVESAGVTPLLLDVSLPAGETLVEPVPSGHTAFLAIYQGSLSIGETAAMSPAVAVLGDGEAVTVATAKADAQYLLAAAAPLDEPVARYGPFVMTTREELAEAFEDYRRGRF